MALRQPRRSPEVVRRKALLKTADYLWRCQRILYFIEIGALPHPSKRAFQVKRATRFFEIAKRSLAKHETNHLFLELELLEMILTILTSNVALIRREGE